MKLCIVLGLTVLTAFCYGKAITKPTSLESDLNGKFDSVNSLTAETTATNPTTTSTTAENPTITTTAKPERAPKTPKTITQKISKKVLKLNLEESPSETKSEILSEYKQPSDITVPRQASAPQQIQEAPKEQNDRIIGVKTEQQGQYMALPPFDDCGPPPPSQQNMPHHPLENIKPEPTGMLQPLPQAQPTNLPWPQPVELANYLPKVSPAQNEPEIPQQQPSQMPMPEAPREPQPPQQDAPIQFPSNDNLPPPQSQLEILAPPQQAPPMPSNDYQPQQQPQILPQPEPLPEQQTSIEEPMIPKAQQDYVQSKQQQQTQRKFAEPIVRWVYKPAKEEHNQESVPPPIGQGIVVSPAPQQQQPKMESYHIQPEMPPIPLPQETLSMPQPPQTEQPPQVQPDILLPQQQSPQNYRPQQPELAPQQTAEMPETPNFPPQVLPQGLENQKPQAEISQSPSQQQPPTSSGQGEYRPSLKLTPLSSISMKRQM
jgi:hypothetical protein